MRARARAHAHTWSWFTVGSSPYTSSPTSASHIAIVISAVGLVTVSDRKSATRGGRAGLTGGSYDMSGSSHRVKGAVPGGTA